MPQESGTPLNAPGTTETEVNEAIWNYPAEIVIYHYED